MSILIKYRVPLYLYDCNVTIKAYEVVKETDKMITYKRPYESFHSKKIEVQERREHKETASHKWFDTFDDAKTYLIKVNEKRVKTLEIRL